LDIDRITKSRNEVQQELHDLNIGTGIHFMSLHLHDYYRKTYGFEPEDFPNAKFISERTISLPLSPKLNEKDVEDVTAAVKHVFS
jgi:dTDP-4-amino-4,6-dideoxygalactose transaminase